MNKKNIGVAVLDTGIYRHIDFDNRIIAFKDFINNKNIPYDDSGHGTQWQEVEKQAMGVSRE